MPTAVVSCGEDGCLFFGEIVFFFGGHSEIVLGKSFFFWGKSCFFFHKVNFGAKRTWWT